MEEWRAEVLMTSGDRLSWLHSPIDILVLKEQVIDKWHLEDPSHRMILKISFLLPHDKVKVVIFLGAVMELKWDIVNLDKSLYIHAHVKVQKMVGIMFISAEK